MNSSVSSSELFDSRYVVYRKDRSTDLHSKGGGVLIAVLKRFQSKRMIEWESSLEELWLMIEFPSACTIKQISICAIYLPSPIKKTSLELFFKNCTTIIEHSNHNCIIGDFNLSSIDWCSLKVLIGKYPELCQSLIDFTLMNGLKQYNTTVNNLNRILDLVLSDLPTCMVKSSHNLLSKLDNFHPPLDIVIPFTEAPVAACGTDSEKLNFWKADYERICKELVEYDWKYLFADVNDVNVMLDVFYEKVRNIINIFVPKKKVRSNSYPPWFDRGLMRSLREKNNLRRRFKRYGNPMDELELKLLSSRCSRLIGNCYNRYISNLETQITKNPKLFWSYVKSKRGGTSSYPISMTDGHQKSSDGRKICRYFATHFGSTYSSGNDDVTHNCAQLANPLDTSNCGVLLTSPTLDRDMVLKKLKSINLNKGAGPDEIPPIFIVRCAEYLVDPLLTIFNTSLATGIFPSAWKTAKIVPVFKSGDENLVSNYRPISILSCLAKLLESLVCPCIIRHTRLFLSNFQHGFVQHRSTATNLVDFSESLLESLDSNKQVDVIYTDFSKAFDRVPHHILLHKLSLYGFSDSMWRWVKSYLDNRSFHIVLNGFNSQSINVTSGVPQGSHLGPVLFNIFVNDIPLRFRYSKPYLYADDLKFCREINDVEDSVLLQSELDEVVAWCSENGMTLNASKCFVVKFGRKHNMVPYKYHINNILIQELDKIRDLGVIFDNKLTFVPHIDNVVSRASRMLGFVLRNIKSFRSCRPKIMLYNSLVRSILEYCSVVWRPHYATHSLRLERIQKRFVWHLMYSCGISKKKLSSYRRRLSHFNVMSLENRRILLDMSFVSKVFRHEVDCSQLLQKFKLRVPFRYPRNKITPLSVPPRKTVFGSNSPVARLCGMVNVFSDSIDIHHDSPLKIRRVIAQLLDCTK